MLGLSRLVPRKGFDRLIDAVGRLAPAHPDLVLAIAGSGRDRARLERRAERRGAPVRFLGRVSDDDLPQVHGAADVFAMICRNRWLGLEQEGFGIVFLEAAACGVPQLAGASGGSHEAVVDGVTGVVVRRPRSAGDVTRALAPLLDHPERRTRLGCAARDRVVERAHLRRPGRATGRGDRRRVRLATMASGQQKGKRERAVPAHRVGREHEVRPEPALPDDPAARRIVQASLAGTVIFAVTAIPAAIAPDTFVGVSVIVSLVLFALGMLAFVWAYAVAVGRSRTDLIGIGGLFFLAGSAPRRCSGR